MCVNSEKRKKTNALNLVVCQTSDDGCFHLIQVVCKTSYGDCFHLKQLVCQTSDSGCF